jgi:hypothetical protein
VDNAVRGVTRICDLSREAITCLDSWADGKPPTAEELADQGLKTLRDVPKHFGVAMGVFEHDVGCEYWPARGPERFTGPWNATLEYPMLVISNTADPSVLVACCYPGANVFLARLLCVVDCW